MGAEATSDKAANESKTNAGLAGAGGGTLIAVIANQLPASNIARPILQYAAPSISISIAALWVFMQVKVANHFRDREVDFLFQKAREKLKKRIADPHISEDHRSYLQEQLEEIDSIDINRIKSKIEKLKVITSQDLKNSGNTASIPLMGNSQNKDS